VVEVTSRRGTNASPLRYPGGKARLAGFFEDVIESLELHKPTYFEPYAGGAGAGLELLVREKVGCVVINDLDPAIHACWKAMIFDSDRFLHRMEKTSLTIKEWQTQREIYRRRHDESIDPLHLGFATFYLNRTCRSGVLGAGAIGGLQQVGNYKMDARYPKTALKSRIEKLAEMRSRIRVTSFDGAARLEYYLQKDNLFVYVDPPYVEKGSSLYMSAFKEEDHVELARVLNANSSRNWILTYDVSDLIKGLYKARKQFEFELLYSAYLRDHGGEKMRRTKATELMVFSKSVADAVR
jgi:DNA adenine methylase